MLNDLFSVLIATLGMPLFLLIPGYALGSSSKYFGFSTKRGLTRLLIGIALSVTIFPSISYLLGRVTSLNLVLFGYGCTWVIFIWQMLKTHPENLPTQRPVE